jgi:hypothetical protein
VVRDARGPGDMPGEKVPSNTWLMSMTAGGCVRDQRGVSSGDEVKVPSGRGEGQAAEEKERVGVAVGTRCRAGL